MDEPTKNDEYDAEEQRIDENIQIIKAEDEIKSKTQQEIMDAVTYWSKSRGGCSGCANMECNNTWDEILSCMKNSRRKVRDVKIKLR